MSNNLTKRSFFLLAIIVLISNYVCADEILMRNGDRITGKVIDENLFELKVYTGVDRPIVVNKEFIRRHDRDQDQPEKKVEKVYVPQEIEEINEEKQVSYEPEVKSEKSKEVDRMAERQEIVKNAVSVWERKISLGYSQSGGNVESTDMAFDLLLSKKRDVYENTIKLGGVFSSADNRSTARKFNGMLRTATSFGSNNKWYRYLKLDGDHDRFSNIDQRFVPSVGLGYWFSDTDGFKAMVEAGLGAEYTNFRDDTKNETRAVFVPRAFVEKKLKNMRLSQEMIAYPSLKDSTEYRIHSETAVTNPISDNVFLRFSLIDDFNSRPNGDTEKNDYRMTSALDVKF
ncbi:MAG: DUF481 domain-containing protein [Candidatus Omnitrophica bacterium]|nr:DUF481 domain-containing protein [Candidatus Omnitrophota bacterium]MBU1997332.1 DUF481 domain-containing protein [Candidatus Omnitrophota bacterium]MBU4332858.1 DUF481 domain-containing protein [Candidatus Omnitrophota bacterium]